MNVNVPFLALIEVIACGFSVLIRTIFKAYFPVLQSQGVSLASLTLLHMMLQLVLLSSSVCLKQILINISSAFVYIMKLDKIFKELHISFCLLLEINKSTSYIKKTRNDMIIRQLVMNLLMNHKLCWCLQRIKYKMYTCFGTYVLIAHWADS